MPSIISAGTTTGTALSLTSDTSGELQIRTNNGSTTAMTLTTGGLVGIGTTSPANWLDISAATSATVGHISLNTTSSSQAIRQFFRESGTAVAQVAWSVDGNALELIAQKAASQMIFYTASTERMRITSAGDVRIGGTSDVFAPKLGITTSSSFPIAATTSQVAGSIFTKSTDGAGNQILMTSNNSFNYGVIGVNNANGTSAGDQFQLGYVSSAGAPATGVLLWGRAATCVGLNTAPATSGTGITFPATQSASSDANTLDDYEEGEWTPSITFGSGSTGITYASRLGRYTKIGRMITVGCFINLTSKGSSTGGAQITGLPFPAFTGNGSNPFYVGVLVGESGMASMPTGTYALAWSDSTLYLRYNAATSFANLNDGNFSNIGAVYATVTYEVG